MPSYQVLVEAATILKANSVFKDNDDKVLGYDHTSITYPQGAIVPESEISPVVLDLYDAGDEHTLSCLKKVDDVVPEDEVSDEEETEEEAEEVVEGTEPITGYDNLTVAEIVELLDVADEDTVATVKLYEAEHKGRVTILNYEAPIEDDSEEPSEDGDEE